MPDVRIPPALTAEEWAEEWEIPAGGDVRAVCSDPDNITRADVENLRDLVAAVRAIPRRLTIAISLKGGDRLADLLESYLPPREP